MPAKLLRRYRNSRLSSLFPVCLVVALLFLLAGLSCKGPSDQGAVTQKTEPDAGLAACWWPPQKNVWTPIGWKDHLFRFNVLYNGTVIAEPNPVGREATAKWDGQGVQLTIGPARGSAVPADEDQAPYQLSSLADGGIGDQGWNPNPAPVLWTEWPLADGLVLREEIFAHLPGAGDIESGIEPLYAWIRLSVSHVDELKAPDSCGFIIHLGAVHVRKSMEHSRNLLVVPRRSAYPRRLHQEALDTGSSRGCLFLEHDGRVRLAALSPDSASFGFTSRKPGYRDEKSTAGAMDYYLAVTLPARQGASADLLLPMIPGERPQVAAETGLGFERALEEADRYWSKVPETAASIETPEKRLDQAIGQSLKFAQIIAEKNPSTGEYTFLSGSWQYDRLWPTPTSMTSHMLLDNLGYHAVVERHLELFRNNQGTVRPPGPSYPLHPGYFSSPKTLTSIDWLADHGAVLYEISRHALLSGDREFVDRWLVSIVKACEFIRDARAITGHDGVPGVLPPAVATDRKVPTQSVWNIGWNYKGLSAAVRLLRLIGHPRAEEFAREAGDYRETFLGALRESVVRTAQWKDARGLSHPLVPPSLSAGGEISHAFYLDAGPLFLVWSGLLPAGDELMQSMAAFFREGPNTRLFDPRGNCWQRPVLIHEISSCEPCYSWNIYHSWQLEDRYRFLEGLYSLLAGALSPQTFISCETRHGIYGNIFAAPLLVDLVRLSVIDDLIGGDELHLLRLVPRAWIKPDFLTRFANMPTEFGPVTVAFRLSENGKALDVSFRPEFRRRPAKIVLHVPPVDGLTRVIVNDRRYPAVPGDLLTID